MKESRSAGSSRECKNPLLEVRDIACSIGLSCSIGLTGIADVELAGCGVQRTSYLHKAWRGLVGRLK